MSGIAAAAVVVAFDSTIVSTSLPQVALALDGLSLYAWVGTGYFLASAVSILIFGRLGDLYGRKPLMLFVATPSPQKGEGVFSGYFA